MAVSSPRPWNKPAVYIWLTDQLTAFFITPKDWKFQSGIILSRDLTIYPSQFEYLSWGYIFSYTWSSNLEPLFSYLLIYLLKISQTAFWQAAFYKTATWAGIAKIQVLKVAEHWKGTHLTEYVFS